MKKVLPEILMALACMALIAFASINAKVIHNWQKMEHVP